MNLKKNIVKAIHEIEYGAGPWDCPANLETVQNAVRFMVLVLAMAILAGCGESPKGSPSPKSDLPVAKVRSQLVESKMRPAFEEVVGTVRARLQATIEAKARGRITEMPILLGQKVGKGTLLARLDAPEVKARLEQAEAAFQQAERDWKRMSSLLEQQAASRADFDTADARYLQAKGAVAEARALLDYVEILAPFDGVVARKWADVGDLAEPGKRLVELEDPSALKLEADVPEAIVSGIEMNGRLAVKIERSDLEVTGTVSEISPAADPASRTFRVKLDLPTIAEPTASSAALTSPSHTGRVLSSGQFARLLVPVGQSSSLRIPASALVQRGQMETVFAVEEHQARLHLVRTGRQVGNELDVLSGLEGGERVVTEGAEKLLDGQPVDER